ncbi:lyase family protein [Microbacterium sp. RD1]|uniref:lyase family protein n=1 Tax=Microbacterium sp. RD1 TaxID=3457313 RepID=UPI003FA54423
MSPFSLLLQVAGPSAHARIWSAESSVEGWLAFERALALAQAEAGIIDRSDARAIAAAAVKETIDAEELWTSARLVGYPILGLVRQIARAISGSAAGRVHYGATTQDVMDTAVALQMQRSLVEFDRGLARLGDGVVRVVEEHRVTVMAARTHAQQAVPTTFGATMSTFLAQLAALRVRIAEALPRIGIVSLYGAGGTSAAYGPSSAALRRDVAERLGLGVRDVPWHVDRSSLAEFGWLCSNVAATCARLARNVIDLSRTEVGEVSERFAAHRGASSTMPQKTNPISSEIIVGLAASAAALTGALSRVQEAGHERAAGEWQIEWHILPQLAELAGCALAESADLVAGLQVDVARMRDNLSQDGGLVMAEAVMIRLADSLGQAPAHDLVYRASRRARQDGIALHGALTIEREAAGTTVEHFEFGVEDYLGEAGDICDVAITQWAALPGASDMPPPEPAALAHP